MSQTKEDNIKMERIDADYVDETLSWIPVFTKIDPYYIADIRRFIIEQENRINLLESFIDGRK